jgi:hypothetical protein
MRQANAIDFWRGFALITIFIDHIPGNLYERATYRNVSISDAAELFVFLAGWSLALATTGDTPGRVVLRLFSRTVEVYRAQLVITAMALAMIAAAAVWTENPLLLEWHDAGPFFADPIRTTIGWVVLTHQLGYFNILPLYVVVLAMAPAFVLLARVSRLAALAASFTLYAVCLVFGINLPTWPVEDQWFFNPLAWQVLLVLGFVGAVSARDDPAFERWCRRLQPLGFVGVALGAVAAYTNWSPDPVLLPEPRLLFTFDKHYLSPPRLLHFLAVVLAFQSLYGPISRHLPRMTRHLSALGRNSLAVFSVASILSLVGQIVRFWIGGGFIIDTVVVSCGIFCLAFTAWFVEWRSRSPRPSLSA